MKRICGIAAPIALFAMSAAAQDTPGEKMRELEKMLTSSRIVGMSGGVMGRSVKGAPYSGQEVNENTQVLGDGTRIHNESRAKVFRDSEGRVRREFGDHVTIWDPVANVNYTLDTKNMTAVKSPMGGVFMRMTPPPGAAFGRGMVVAEALPAGQVATWTSEEGKVKAKLKAAEGDVVEYAPTTSAVRVFEREVIVSKDGKKATTVPDDVHFFAGEKFEAAVPMMAGTVVAGSMAMRRESANLKTEALGEQVMEGVKARGTKQTSTIEAGAIGNDRPMTTVFERWYSDDLQTEVMTRRSDPRTGEHTFRLITVNRGEPGSYLFQVPSGYTLTDRK